MGTQVHRSARRVGTAALISLGLVTASGVAQVPAAANPASSIPQAPRFSSMGRGPVYVVGDSLTLNAAPWIYQRYAAAGPQVAVNGGPGRKTPEGIRILARAPAAARAKVWVVALGTNDAVYSATFAQYVRTVMAWAGARTVIWVNINRPGSDIPINAALAKMDDIYRNLMVINFKSSIASFPAYLRRDRIHLTTAGYTWRAQFYGPVFS